MRRTRTTGRATLATRNAHYDLGVWLLEHGADPNADGQGWTALHQLVWARRPNLGYNNPAPNPTGRVSDLEFVEALVSLGDAALAADAHLRSLYPSPPERCRAIFDVWCLADVCDEVAAAQPAPRRPRWRSSFAARPA